MQKINALIAATLIFGSYNVYADCTQENLNRMQTLIQECNQKTNLQEHIDCMLASNWDAHAENISQEIKNSPDVKAAYIDLLYDKEIQRVQDDIKRYETDATLDAEDKAELEFMKIGLEMLKKQRQYVADNLSNIPQE